MKKLLLTSILGLSLFATGALASNAFYPEGNDGRYSKYVVNQELNDQRQQTLAESSKSDETWASFYPQGNDGRFSEHVTSKNATKVTSELAKISKSQKTMCAFYPQGNDARYSKQC